MSDCKSRHIIILFTLFAVVGCKMGEFARFSSTKKFPAAVIHKDMSAMESVLMKYHPSLYWYSDSLQITAAFNEGRTLVRDSMTEPEIRNLYNKVVSSVRCGHTSVRHSKIYSIFLTWKSPAGFPLGIKILDDSTLVIVSNYNRSDSLLTRGVKILSVNDYSAPRLIDTLSPLVPIDGYATTFSHQLLSNNFPRFYNSIFPRDSAYRIVYADSLGNTNTTVAHFYNRYRDSASWKISFRKAKKIVPSNKLMRKEMIRSFLIDTINKTAFLKLNTFSSDINKKYIRRKFRILHKQKIPYLILDLRNNGGGLISHSLLLARLIHKTKFKYVDSVVTPVSKIRKLSDEEGRITKRFWINTAMFFLNRKNEKGLYSFKLFSGKYYKPHRLHYQGKVYILTGGATFSAASMLIASLKGLPNVQLIGEETGGGAYGNNGIFIPDLILPNTKLRMRLPLYRIVNNRQFSNNGRGVIPDVEVKATAESIRKSKDIKVEKAEELIMQDKILQASKANL